MLDPRTQSPLPNPNFANWQFRADNPKQEAAAMESDNSGVNSPPLWKNSPSPSHHLSLSPNSRTQAIAKGQWELMEMVRNMPESSYELSLKDLVEHHQTAESQNPNLGQKGEVKMKRQESKKAVKFEDKGLFLNVVFPFSIKSKKRASKLNLNLKVSPRPDGERDWWKKKFTGSSDSDSSRTTTTSGGSSSSSAATTAGSDDGPRAVTGCWQIFQSRKSKPVE